MSSVELVPGDVIFLSTNGGFMMECDAVLVEGTCVVNESMLTGESIPITKVKKVFGLMYTKKIKPISLAQFNWSMCFISDLKVAVPDDDSASFNYDLHRQHVVFCGTEVLQGKASTGNYCKAIVIRTGEAKL